MKRELETHLLGIHNTSILSGEPKAGQTLSDHTADATMVPGITDHLIPKALAKNFSLQSERLNQLRCLLVALNLIKCDHCLSHILPTLPHSLRIHMLMGNVKVRTFSSAL